MLLKNRCSESEQIQQELHKPGLESTNPSHVLEGHTKGVTGLFAKGNVLVSVAGGADKTIRIWCLETFTQTHIATYEVSYV